MKAQIRLHSWKSSKEKGTNRKEEEPKRLSDLKKVEEIAKLLTDTP